MNKSAYDLRQMVQAALNEDREMQEHGIEVLDTNGIITLTGTVPTPHARERAETIVREVDGVTNVINELDVI